MSRAPKRYGSLRRLAGLVALVAGALTSAPAGAANVWLNDGGNALNTRTGSGPSASKSILPKQVWSVTFDKGEATGTPIIGPNGAVFVGTTAGEVHAYARTTGRKLWTANAAGLKPAPILGSLLWADNMVWAVVSRPGAVTLVGIDPMTGLVLRSVVVDSQRHTQAVGGPNYSAQNNTIFVATCTCAAEENLTATSNKGVLAAVDPTLGTLKWKIATAVHGGGGVVGSPLVIDQLNRVVVGTGHSYAVNSSGISRDPYTDALLSVDQLTGQIVGVYQIHRDDGGRNSSPDPRRGKGFYTSPNAMNGRTGLAIGAGAGDGNYYVVDAATMTPLYAVPVGTGRPGGPVQEAATDGRYVFGLTSAPGLYWALESRTGALKAAAPIADPVARGPISVGSRVAWWTTLSGVVQTSDPTTGRPYGGLALGAPSTSGVALGYGNAVIGIGTGEGTPGGLAVFK